MAAKTISRSIFLTALSRLAKYPAVGILGPRQVGKTTLAKALARKVGKQVLLLDLENSEHADRLAAAQAYLWRHKDKLIVIDEVQRMPHLFPIMRSLIDRDRRPGRFLLLGSSSPAIIRKSAESLAGRIAYLDLFPFSLSELPAKHRDRLWLRGGFPEAFLADDHADAFLWLDNYIRNFVERDMALLGLNAAPAGTRAMLAMLATAHGQQLNMSTIAKSIGMSIPTVKRYLDFFEQAFLVTVLPSYHVNLRKRLTKTPKIYLSDTGLLHSFSRIRDLEMLRTGILAGHSWEGFVIQQVRARYADRVDLHYFRTMDGSELDLVLTHGTKLIAAVEIKTTNSPALSKGNQLAFEAVKAPLQLICTPSAEDFPYSKLRSPGSSGSIRVCSLGTLFKHLDKVVG